MSKKLLTHLRILTFNENFTEIDDGAILIDGSTITETGPTDVLKKHTDAVIVDCTDKVAMPGLINAHTHIPMSFLKGLGHSDPEIIYSLMFPAEKNLLPSDIEILTKAGAAEALRSGCTTVVEHYYFAEEIARSMKNMGLRGFVGHTTMDRMGPHTGEKEYRASYNFVEKWRGDPLITPVLAPHATDTVSEEKLRELLRKAETEDLLLHLHVAQTQKEVSFIKKEFNKTPVEFLENLGFLSDRVLAAHLIYVTDSDIAILKKRRVNFLCCVVSQLFFEKLAPIDRLLKAGINFCPGTDCVVCNDGMNLLHEGRALNLLLIDRMKDPLVLSSKEILSMLTVNSAKALKVDDRLGTLEAGKLADILILDLNTPTTRPLHNIYNTILFSSTERNIDSVIVNGETVIQGGHPVNFDEREIASRLSRRAKEILERSS